MAARKKNSKTTTSKTSAAAKPAGKRGRGSTAASGKRNNNSPKVVTVPTYDQIARRAYEIWIAKGQPTGQDEINWREAERDLMGLTPR